MGLECCGVVAAPMDTESLTTRGGGGWGMGHFLLLAPDDEPLNNYNEDHKLMEGALIKLGDYAHFRYFVLYRNGRFCYYELPLPTGGASAGPRRVHLTLTAEHLRGVMMLNASIHAKEQFAKTDDEYDADLIKRGLMFNRRNLEMNLTGFSPTGQLMSWKLRASNDATYVKWERAFRLALRPIWVQNAPTCLVCKQTFTFLFRPHHCRKCGTCMCVECSVFVPRLPMQGYYDEVRICRDCSPSRIRRSSLKADTRVLVYGVFAGRVVQVDALSDHADDQQAFVSVELVKRGRTERFALEYVELYSETILSANRIKSAIRTHLARVLFRTQLNFSTWNVLEAVQEQRTVQMVRILNKSTSIAELQSMIPALGSIETFSLHLPPLAASIDGFDYDNEEDMEDENDLIHASLAHYRGVHVVFPLRLDTVTKLIDQFRNGILLHRVYVHHILDEAARLFQIVHASPMNAIELQEDVTLIVVGDLHGQLEDLLTILDKNGLPSHKTWYLFNGDFVDRGSHGVEVLLLLLTFKLLYPEFVFLNRGNHEERMINEVFGFEDEVYTKYNTDNDELLGWKGLSASLQYAPTALFQLIETVFELFPLFAVVNASVFVVHGGLSSHTNVTLDELRRIQHQREIPTQSTLREDELFTHLLWSDPRDRNGCSPSSRGAGVEFGPDITRRFCQLNHLCLVIRSHECQEEGYEITHDGLMLTVFSASSYCGSQTNKGAVVQLTLDPETTNVTPHVVQYYAQPLQKLRVVSKNEWRQKAQRLEKRTLGSLVELICEKKSALLAAFIRNDVERTGRVSKLVWRDVLKATLAIDVQFLLYFPQLAADDEPAHHEHHECPSRTSDGVDYRRFLNRYTIALEGEDAEWRKQIAHELWLGFMRALAATSSSSSHSNTSSSTGSTATNDSALPPAPTQQQDKLHAAFELFHLAPSSDTSSNNTIEPVSNRQNHKSFRDRGLVTYDVFRSTLQRRVVLAEHLTEQQVVELMAHMDTNHDGVVDFAEFAAFFADASRSAFLADLFDGEDVRAIELLHQFGARVVDTTVFATRKDAFAAFDRRHAGRLDVADIATAWQHMELHEPVAALDDHDAMLLFDSILRAFYGVARVREKTQRGLDFDVFDDVFAPDSTRQRRLRLESWTASTNNLAALIDASTTSTVLTDDDSAYTSPQSSRRRLNTWAEPLADSVKHALHEQRLYLKLLFRMLDRKRIGVVPTDKFIAVVNVINEQHGSLLDRAELEQLASAFAYRPRSASTANVLASAMSSSSNNLHLDSSDPTATLTDFVAYPLFLRSLRVIDAKCKCC